MGSGSSLIWPLQGVHPCFFVAIQLYGEGCYRLFYEHVPLSVEIAPGYLANC